MHLNNVQLFWVGRFFFISVAFIAYLPKDNHTHYMLFNNHTQHIKQRHSNSHILHFHLFLISIVRFGYDIGFMLSLTENSLFNFKLYNMKFLFRIFTRWELIWPTSFFSFLQTFRTFPSPIPTTRFFVCESPNSCSSLPYFPNVLFIRIFPQCPPQRKAMIASICLWK